ncbi:hypothetical protein C8A05DRAFT_15954 [Staphylotrichum tortipilum]|uniref:Uncharacterized protein n=1 Tax=Staphylotrichum tortipilum TaxID=2831512 RepID=A0AAN6MJU9_9PEZI|nr:hypothetical protein C8A05DRAFT_15954 [Staphylotrichum longicolle]
MPAHGRSPAPSLPPVNDEATIPFSDLFASGFDSATVDATTQLADRGIFVASNGRRYRFESIPDHHHQHHHHADLKGPPPPARPPPPPTPAISSSSTSSLPPPPHPHLRTQPPPPHHDYLSWGRSPSTTSSLSYSSRGAYSVRSNGYAAAPGPPEPPRGPPLAAAAAAHAHAHDDQDGGVTGMMAQLSINRFGATPMYGESDGGVQAAETLTDPDVAPHQQQPVSPTSPDDPSASSYDFYHNQYSYQQQASHYTSSHPWSATDHPSPGAAPHYWTNVNYANYTTQTNALLQSARQQAVATTGLPSLLEDATALVTPPTQHPPTVEYCSDKEVWDGGAAQGGYYGSGYPPQVSVSAPTAGYGEAPERGYAGYAGEGGIDTLTPVVVPQQQQRGAVSVASDGASTGRDNVLPGEDLLFDGPVKSAQSLSAPVFREGVLKVFRNTITNDLRFHCKVDRESETYWMKASNAQLVPAYAYDQRLSKVVYIRDKESDKGSGYMQAAQGNCRPSGIYQFDTLRELFDFQARLTGEKVVLDIGSVRLVTLSRASSRSSTQFSGARLQIWHELEGGNGRRGAQSDVASFVTAGTALSGPLRERLVASPSRLILYLGRMGGYVTAFITDDLEIKADGQTLVKLKPRKAPTPFSRKGSRFQWVKARMHPNQGSEPAGLDIDGKALEVEVGSDYDSYKTFEIEFETSPSQDNFVRKWDEVMRERRAQRMRLTHIQEGMESAVFTGRQARGVFM